MTHPKFTAGGSNFETSYNYGNVFANQITKSGNRLCVSASDTGSRLLGDLASLLDPPYYLLYVLVVPRGGSAAGRYQSPELSRDMLASTILRFGRFWDNDGRHAIWILSIPENTTLVYSRDNLIYLYGNTAVLKKELLLRSYSEVVDLKVPFPHEHAYLEDNDLLERECTNAMDWHHSDLRSEDEN
jgi:hypothetical protein